jgi:hypothetical protein
MSFNDHDASQQRGTTQLTKFLPSDAVIEQSRQDCPIANL